MGKIIGGLAKKKVDKTYTAKEFEAALKKATKDVEAELEKAKSRIEELEGNLEKAEAELEKAKSTETKTENDNVNEDDKTGAKAPIVK